MRAILAAVLVLPLFGTPAAANPVYLRFICDLNGMPAEMAMQVEAIGSTGIVSGPTGDITGVIGTGGQTLYISGEVRSQTGRYVFTGENQYADFTDVVTHDRFRVQWVEQPGGLMIIVNPFADPARQGRHFCQLVQG